MLADKVVLEGIFSKGYGTIAKSVMKDKDLSVEAKAIYAYLCSYSGSGESAFPSVNLIKEDLNISENRFLKHRKVLVEKGYISIKRNKTSNGWSNNIYTIHTVVHLQNEGIQNEGIQNEGIQNEGIQNEGTNNNSITNNSITNNKSNKDIAKKKKSIKESYGEFENVLLTKEEHQKLQERFPNDLKQRIEKLSLYVESTGKKYKSHYATIIMWAKKDDPKKTTSRQSEIEETQRRLREVYGDDYQNE